MKRLFLCPLLLVLYSPSAFAVLGGYNDPILDTNNNGLSDVWERIYNNGELFPSMSPLDDDDSDGWTNAEEAVAGTDPKSSLSPVGILRPEVAVIHDVLLDLDNDGIPESYAEVATITWPVISGKFYTLLYSPDMTGDSWIPLQQAAATSDGTRTAYFPVSPPDDKMFWRVSIEDIDSDGDGLTDAEEYKLGIDPHNAQTIDGIPDFWLATHFTNILLNGGLSTIDPDADPDGDGYTNLQEAFLNTNPNVSNTPITGPIGQETIVNGDFSEPAIGTGYRSAVPDPTWDYWGQGGVPGWSAVTGTNIELQINPEENSGQYVELKAYPVGHYGIKQNVGTHKGATYMLTLDCRDRADVSPASSNFNLLIDGQIVRQMNFSDPNATTLPSVYVAPGTWTTITMLFTADNPITLLSLVPLNSLEDTTGCLVVHVKLAPVKIVPDANMAGVIGAVVKSAKAGSTVKHFVTPKKSAELNQDYVVLTAVGVTPDQITDGNANQIVQWDGGESVPNEPSKRRVKRDATGNGPTEVAIKRKQGGAVAAQMDVWVVWGGNGRFEQKPTHVVPSAKSRKNIAGDDSNTVEVDPDRPWLMVFALEPKAMFDKTAEVPDLLGTIQSSGLTGNHPILQKPLAGGAKRHWDVSRRFRETITNSAGIAKGLFPAGCGVLYANQPIANEADVAVDFPGDSTTGNDDASVTDEINDPYNSQKLRTSYQTQPGEVASNDIPELFMTVKGLKAGEGTTDYAEFKEFVRLNVGGNWYRVSEFLDFNIKLQFTMDQDLQNVTPTGSDVNPK